MESALKQGASRAQYDAAFELERVVDYPTIAAFEGRAGYWVDRARLEAAARILACPVKRNPPNWQHGRVLYAALRRYLTEAKLGRVGRVVLLDIGTAKGFSAVVMAWVLADSGYEGAVVSFDVVSPDARVSRNTVADLDGLPTVYELTDQFLPRPRRCGFFEGGSAAFFRPGVVPERVHFAFVDGKHTFEAVTADAEGIAALQQPGDVIVFDDMQIPGVEDAVGNLVGYDVEHLVALPHRRYAIATRV